jgi:KDO2-lipid IV(A) lauroyltransferase
MNIVFLDTRKIKRGYYETTLSIITKNPQEHKDYELTEMYLRKVEAQIKAQPEYYFWTHKRFKHKDKAPK